MMQVLQLMMRVVSVKKGKKNPFSKLFNKPFVNPGDGQFEFELGKTFINVHSIRAAFRDYRVKGGYPFHKEKNDKTMT